MIVNMTRRALGHLFGMGLDNKRNNAWCEYGYKEQLDFDDLYSAYRRHSLAHGAVDKVNNAVWSDYPIIYRGSDSKQDEAQDEYEVKLNKIFNRKIWKEFKEADKRRMIGRWSALILYFNDAEYASMGDPVPKNRNLTLRRVKAAWQNCLTVAQYDDYGEPLIWDYKEVTGENERIVTIHRDRVFILGDRSPDGLSFLEAGFNSLVNLEKIEGATGESFAKNAARQIHLNYQSDAEIEDDPDKPLRKSMNDVVKDLNQGNDVALVTQGVTATTLTAPVPDPSNAYTMLCQLFCSSIQYPFRYIIGNETGERASTEDLKQANAANQYRRETLITDEIIEFIEKIMRLEIIEWEEIGVTWEDLTVPTSSEKLATALTMAEINLKSMQLGNDKIFTESEIRGAGGYDTDANNSTL